MSRKLNELEKQNASDADQQGSYTGKPKNPKEKPVQDADDL